MSASSPFVEDVNTGLHSARTEIFTRMFPRCGIPDHYGSWQSWEDYVAFLYRTGSITEHTQIWWSLRPHLAYPTIEIRICDGQPDLAEAQSLAALGYALAARCARTYDEGEALPTLSHRLLEENMWRAIRYGLSGELSTSTAASRFRPASGSNSSSSGSHRWQTRSAQPRTSRSRRRTPPNGRSSATKKAPA